MHRLRLLIIAAVTVCLLGLAAFAVAHRPAQPVGDDVIIIKGGSLEITCGKNHGNDCLGTADGHGKYKHKKDTSHITRIEIKDSAGMTLYSGAFTPTQQPQIEVTYK